MLAILQRCAGSSCQSTRLVRPEMLDRLCHTTVGELTSLSAINVETRNHAESQNQRLVKAAAAGDTDDSDRRKHSKLCEPLMAAWDSSHYVTYTYRKNSHVYMLSQKICTPRTIQRTASGSRPASVSIARDRRTIRRTVCDCCPQNEELITIENFYETCGTKGPKNGHQHTTHAQTIFKASPAEKTCPGFMNA